MLRALVLLGLAAAPALVATLGRDDEGCEAPARTGAVHPLSERRSTDAGEPLARPALAPAGTLRAAVERGLRLRVVDAEDQRPLAGATVRWRASRAWSLPVRSDACDELGRWESAADPAGPVIVEAPGYVPRDVRALVVADRELEVCLFRAAERDVVLRVTTEAGEPIAGATLLLRARDLERSLCTDEAGQARIRLSGGVPSLRLEGRAEAPGCLSRGFSALDLGTGELRVWNEALSEERATIVLDRSVSAFGIVVDQSGAPLSDVLIAVRAQRFSGSSDCAGGLGIEPSLEARTDSSGRYVLDGLPAGRALEWVLIHGHEVATHAATLAGRGEPLDWTFEPQGSLCTRD